MNTSPLQYPGGKKFALQAGIMKYFPQKLDELCSPFFGGGSIEIHYANKGTKVYGYDGFEPLTNFWEQLLKYPTRIADFAEEFLSTGSEMKVTKEVFDHLTWIIRDNSEMNELIKDKEHNVALQWDSLPNRIARHFNLPVEKNLLRAACYFIMNRCCYSGKFGNYSCGKRRFRKIHVDWVRNFKCDNLTIACADFTTSLIGDMFAYVDPPYALEKSASHLYGDNGNMHRNFDHQKLADILFARDNWILSYNNCEYIKELYKNYEHVLPTWYYGMADNEKGINNSKEILIFSHNYTPPQGSLNL